MPHALLNRTITQLKRRVVRPVVALLTAGAAVALAAGPAQAAVWWSSNQWAS
jgi:hypothetical protein